MKKILICIFKYHGDVLLTSPVYTSLRKKYPDAEIDVYLFKETVSMLEGHPAISRFITFDQKWRKYSLLKRIWQEITMWRRVRKEKYDIVINLTSGDRGALVALFSGAPVRIGIERESGMKQKNRFFTKVVQFTEKPRHIVERNFDLIRALGYNPNEEDKELLFVIPEAAKAKVDELLPYKEFILIHPVSRCLFKNWGEEKFSQLIGSLRALGENIIISGGAGKEEQEMIAGIMSRFINDPYVQSLAGQISLKELGALILRSKLLVSVDSVPPHIASALKHPTVVLFGPSDEIKWGPWRNPQGRVVRLSLPCQRCDDEGCGGTLISECLNNLSEKRVLKVIQEIIS